MPASRRARAITLAPRSWPSRPGLATRTRILRSVDIRSRFYQTAFLPRRGRDAEKAYFLKSRSRRAGEGSMLPAPRSAFTRYACHRVLFGFRALGCDWDLSLSSRLLSEISSASPRLRVELGRRCLGASRSG